MPKVLIIVNPIAGNRKSKEIAKKFTAFLRQNQFEFVQYTIEQQRDLEGIKQAVLDAKAEFLSIIGGDGTLNDVLNSGKDAQRAMWHIIPCGLSNNFARSFYGALLEPEHFFDRILQPLPLLTDIGRINDVYFLSSASIGIGARVRRFAESGLPVFLPAWFRYKLSLLYHLFSQKKQEGFVIDESGKQEILIEVSGLMFMNAGYVGQGYKMNANNQLNDGIMEYLMVKRTPLLAGFGLIKDLEEGQLRHNNEKSGLKQGRILRIELEQSALYHADGFFDADKTFDVEIIQQKVYILI